MNAAPADPEVIAHRGYAARYPENTLAAIEAALAAGARCVEFDVQLTRNGVPVLMHDLDLARTTGRRGDVTEWDLAAVQALGAGEPARFGTRFAGEPVPTLAAVAARLARHPRVTAFVEIKEESLERFGTEATVRAVLAAIEPARAHCVPISFSDEAVRCARASGAAAIGWVLGALDTAHRDRARALAPAYLFCDHRDVLTRPGRLWPGPWRWAVYEVTTAALARELAARGAGFVETMAVGELLAELAGSRR